MGFVYGDIMGIMVFLWGLFVDISYGDNHVSMGFVCGHIMGIIVFLWDLFVDI